jgi:methylase of polypeptide subunit release factors
MTTIARLLSEAGEQIPIREARLLLAHALGRNTAWLEAHRDDAIVADDAARFAALAKRAARASRSPTSPAGGSSTGARFASRPTC